MGTVTATPKSVKKATPKKTPAKIATPKSAKKATPKKTPAKAATPKSAKKTTTPVQAKGTKRRASSTPSTAAVAKKMKVDTTRTPAKAKTPKNKTTAKTPKTAIKKSVKKRTYADMAKKTPAAKPKTVAGSKVMAAHLQKQNRRHSGRALPTFRLDVPKSFDFGGSSGHALESPAIAISKKKNKTPVLVKTKKGRKTPL